MPYHLLVKKNAKIEDTLNLIAKAVNVYSHSPFVIELTKQLNPQAGSKYDFVKRLFDYVCKNVRYQLDRVGDEEVWSPEKTVREGIGDCKKMTVLIASVLKCAGIEPVLKHVYYANELHTHIYVIVPFPDLNSYLTVDPVNNKQWNTEVKYSKGSLNYLSGEKMNLHMMGRTPNADGTNRYMFKSTSFQDSITGIDDDLSEVAGMGCPVGAGERALYDAMSMDGVPEYIQDIHDEAVSGIGRRGGKPGIFRKAAQPKQPKAVRKAVRKEKRKKVFKVFKKVNYAPMRGSFLLLVRTNIFRLANRMAKVWISDPTALKKMWANFGGKPDKLRDAIKKGASKSLKPQINGIGYYDDYAPTVGELEEMEMSGIGVLPAIAAAIAASTPIVLATIKIVGKSKHDGDQEVPPDEEEPSTTEVMTDSAQNAENIYDASTPEPEISESSEYEPTYTEDGGQDEGGESTVDEVVEGIGADYDYVDGMGRKRKVKKKKKAAKKGKHKITKNDIKTLATLAEYGTNKIIKKQVSSSDMNKLPHDDDNIIKITTNPALNTPTSGSFGLAEINSFADFLCWLKGAMILSFLIALGANLLAVNFIIIGSFFYLTGKHIIRFLKFAAYKLNLKKNHYESKL